jgi:formylglycine-generating enzyme required for sulfatase activity
MHQFVFISHSSKDKDQHREQLRALVDSLVVAGVKVWIDDPIALGYLEKDAVEKFHRIHGDRPWREEIREALDAAGAVLGVWSQQVLDAFANIAGEDDPILCCEIIAARFSNKLLSCRIDDSDVRNYPHKLVDELQVIDIRSGTETYEARLRQLIDNIKRMLAKAAGSTAGARPTEFPWAYLGARVAELGHSEYGVTGELFTPLSLLVPRWKRRQPDLEAEAEPYDSLTKIVRTRMWRHASDPVDTPYTALVILGDPGAGKSTLLRRLEYEFSREAIAQKDPIGAKVCFFVPLNEYKFESHIEPLDWLCERWAAVVEQYPGAPGFKDMLRRESYLLLDALNEMSHTNDAEYEELLSRWKLFIATARQDFPRCRLLFSCRELHYSVGLNTNEILVPHVRIEGLDPPRIRKFLNSYAQKKAGWLYERMQGTRRSNDALSDDDNVGATFGLYNTPYYLRILIDYVEDADDFPTDRASLFTTLVRGRLQEELNKAGGRVTPASLAARGLISSKDIDHTRSIMGGTSRWDTIYGPYGLPKGHLFDQLAKLAFEMQESDKNAREGRVGKSRSIVVSSEQAAEMLSTKLSVAEVKAVFEAAADLNLLSYDRAKNRNQDLVAFARDQTKRRFEHHLIQEYFAGKYIADAGGLRASGHSWHAPWQEGDVPDVPSGLPDKEPLPPLSTAWDETLLFASQMSQDRAAFIDGLMELNLPLAGRAAAQVGAPLSNQKKGQIQDALTSRMKNHRAHLRARIAAGNALGELGDPRFERRFGNPVGTSAGALAGPRGYLRPPTMRIPGGQYFIGSSEPTPPWNPNNKAPRHRVEVSTFEISRFLVTNAEWRCFMDAGGYDEDVWWESDAAKMWRLGKEEDGGSVYACWAEMWSIFRRWLQSDQGLAEKLKRLGEISPDEAETWLKTSRTGSIPDAEFAKWLIDEKVKRDVRITKPAGFIASFESPSQPVVGINWFEARAYCSWLSAQTGETWRLPTENEWEVAARLDAPEAWRYPWGPDFEVPQWHKVTAWLFGRRSAARCNTINARIRSTTPVGVFSSGDTAGGLSDVSGNAFEWTSSKYFDYPYNISDGREDDEKNTDPKEYAARVLRGGSWYYGKEYARLSFRLRYHPGFRARTAGFRLAKSIAPSVLAQGV